MECVIRRGVRANPSHPDRYRGLARLGPVGPVGGLPAGTGRAGWDVQHLSPNRAALTLGELPMTDYSPRMMAAHERRPDRGRERGHDRVSIETAVAGRSAVAVIAPRAGRLAPMTGELAKAVAGRTHRLYCRVIDAAGARRSGQTDPEPTDFDESLLAAVLSGTLAVVTIADSASDEDAMTVICGSNRELAQRLLSALTEVGFAAMVAPPCEADGDPAQLFNRSTDGGVELTLTRRLRKDLDRGILQRPQFDRHVAAVQRARPGHRAGRGAGDWTGAGRIPAHHEGGLRDGAEALNAGPAGSPRRRRLG